MIEQGSTRRVICNFTPLTQSFAIFLTLGQSELSLVSSTAKIALNI